jgi:hypothetical protein
MSHEIDRFHAEHPYQHKVHKTRAGREDNRHNAYKGGDRYEVRQVGNGLDKSLIRPAPYLIQENGEDYGKRKTEQQAVETEQKGVFNQAEKVGVLEEFNEVLKTDPRAPEHTQPCVVFLEGNNNSVHGDIMKNDVKKKTGKQQNKEVFRLFYLFHFGRKTAGFIDLQPVRFDRFVRRSTLFIFC